MLDRLLPLDDSSLWFAVDVGLKATLLLAIAVAMTVVLRAGSAAVRHRVWAITFAALLLLPLANWILPGWNWRVIPRDWQRKTAFIPFADSRSSRSDPAAIGADDGFGPRNPTVMSQNQISNLEPQITSRSSLRELPTVQGRRVSDPAVASDSVAAADQAAVSSPQQRRIGWLFVGWFAAALAALLPLATGVIGNLLLKRRGRRLVDADWQELLEALGSRLGLRRKVSLLVGGPDQMPMTFGWLHPYIVLPAGAANWPRDQRQAVLLHELAHVKRCDVPLQMIARAAFALYWFHPLAWWGIRRMRLEREHACDDCVLLAGQKASSYAAQLLEIARAHHATSPLASAALSMARPSQLEGRLLAVLDAHRSRAPLTSARTAALALLALLIVIVLGSLRPTVQAEGPKDRTDHAASSSPANNSQDNNPDSRLTIRGTVQSPQGQPVPNALIEVIAAEYHDMFRQPNWDTADLPEYYSTTSDALGSFSIALPRQCLSRPQLLAFASAEGFAMQNIWLAPKPHQDELSVRFKLSKPRTIQLQFMDTAGNPTANVEPRIWYLDRMKANGICPADHRAMALLKSWPKCSRTNADGVCELVIPAATEDFALLVEDERFGRQMMRLKPSDDRIPVALKPGRHLNGKVVAADSGVPVEGTELFIGTIYFAHPPD